jgi:hypothetical protein
MDWGFVSPKGEATWKCTTLEETLSSAGSTNMLAGGRKTPNPGAALGAWTASSGHPVRGGRPLLFRPHSASGMVQQGAQKGVRHHLCGAPFGPCRQMVPDPFLSHASEYGTEDSLSWEIYKSIVLPRASCEHAAPERLPLTFPRPRRYICVGKSAGRRQLGGPVPVGARAFFMSRAPGPWDRPFSPRPVPLRVG